MYIKRNNKILVGILSLLLVLSVGYALFSETIGINGTATAKGNFDMGITCDENSGNGTATGTCSVQGNTVTTNSMLTKPGETYYFILNITNNGTIPARIKKVTSPNNVTHDFKTAGDCYYMDWATYLFAYYAGSYGCDSEYELSDLVLEPGQTETLYIFHEWLDSDYYDYLDKQQVLPNGEVSFDYSIIFEFEQVTN